MSKLDDTGERMVPELHKGRNIYGCHIARYEAAIPFVKNKKVLDIACGSGYGTKLLSQHAKDTIGVDISEDAIDYANKHFGTKNVHFRKGDGESIPLEDESVDVVVSYETIEHIKDYKKFMDEVKRVLKPAGVLLLSTPNSDEYPKGNPYHFYEFTYKELKTFIKKYFKFHEDYFQNQWYSSTLLPTDLQSSEWEKQTKTIDTVSLSAEQALYFFIVCSDKKISQKIEPLSVIGEHYRLLDVHNEGAARNEKIQKMKSQINDLEKYRSLYESKVDELNALSSSMSVRLTKPLRVISSIIKRFKKDTV